MIVSIMGVSGVDFENDCSAFPGYRYQRLRRRNPFVVIWAPAASMSKWLFLHFRAMGTSGVDFEIHRSAFSGLWPIVYGR